MCSLNSMKDRPQGQHHGTCIRGPTFVGRIEDCGLVFTLDWSSWTALQISTFQFRERDRYKVIPSSAFQPPAPGGAPNVAGTLGPLSELQLSDYT